MQLEGNNSSNAIDSAGSQPHQHPQPVFRNGHGGRSDITPTLEQAVFADGADGFAEEGGGVGQAAFRRLDRNVKWDGPEGGQIPKSTLGLLHEHYPRTPPQRSQVPLFQ